MGREEIIAEAAALSPGEAADTVAGAVFRRTDRGWIAGFGLMFLLLLMLNFAVIQLLVAGVGIWGVNIPVAWGFAIINFVWWIGIAHAGTLISAILLLVKMDWRTSINRFAEACTLFALACAGIFPLLHLGRPWYFYWLLPYPNTMSLWPQWRSPLVWDVFAVTTYTLVSIMFWYMGLVPDLAMMRDRAQKTWQKAVYGIFAAGWRGSAQHWAYYKRGYLILAALATPLVVSVHSIVSFDFAVGLVPGWHSTIFPPYFVAGAIASGFAMVLTVGIPLRRFYRLERMVTLSHLENMGKIMLVTILMVDYGYLCENFIAAYSGNKFEAYIAKNRLFGDYSIAFWVVLFCNFLVPQVLWRKSLRRNELVLFVVALLVNWGMWLERYVIIVVSLHRDFMPSAWGKYHGTYSDWMILFGSIGLFGTLLFLFVRLVPMIPVFEVKELISEAKEEEGKHG